MEINYTEPANKGLFSLCANIICSPKFCAKAVKCTAEANKIWKDKGKL